MARSIVVSLKGVESSFGFKAVDRNSLYGKRRRVPLDSSGGICTRASLLEDGSLLLRSGMTGQAYFLPDGTSLKQSELEAFDFDGSPLEKVPSTVGVSQELHGPVNAQDVLDLRVKTIYALLPEEVSSDLQTSVDAGDIYKFSFNYRDDYQAETGYLVSNDSGIYALIGDAVSYEWSKLELVTELPAVDQDEDDDLDFEMF